MSIENELRMGAIGAIVSMIQGGRGSDLEEVGGEIVYAPDGIDGPVAILKLSTIQVELMPRPSPTVPEIFQGVCAYEDCSTVTAQRTGDYWDCLACPRDDHAGNLVEGDAIWSNKAGSWWVVTAHRGQNVELRGNGRTATFTWPDDTLLRTRYGDTRRAMITSGLSGISEGVIRSE